MDIYWIIIYFMDYLFLFIYWIFCAHILFVDNGYFRHFSIDTPMELLGADMIFILIGR